METSSSLKQRQKQQVHEELFRIGMRLFREQGVHETTVEQITREAGVAKGTFFNHFPVKESLLYEYIVRENERLIEEAIVLHPSSARAALREFTRSIARFGEHHSDLLLPLTLYKEADPQLKEQEEEQDRNIRGRMNQMLSRDPSLDPEWVTEKGDLFSQVVMSTLSGTVQEWRLSDGSLPLSETMLSRVELLLELLPEQS